MSPEDLDRIERDLGINLPDSYRSVMSGFPIPAFAGNSDTDLWDDADALIERNLELRTEHVKGHGPWPSHCYFFGDPLTACGYALDLRKPDAPVLWVDHCDLDARASGEVAPSFAAWAEQYVAKVRGDLEKDGIDPDGAPDAAHPGTGCLGGLLMLVATGVIAWISTGR